MAHKKVVKKVVKHDAKNLRKDAKKNDAIFAPGGIRTKENTLDKNEMGQEQKDSRMQFTLRLQNPSQAKILILHAYLHF